MQEAVTRDMAFSDWLKLAPFVCFARKVHLKIYPFVTVLAQGRKVMDQHSYLIHSCSKLMPQGVECDYALSDCEKQLLSL